MPLTAQDGHQCWTAGATPVPLTRESRSGTYRLLDAGLHLLAQQAFEDEGVAELLSLRGKGQDPGGLSSRVPPVPFLGSSTLRSRLTSRGNRNGLQHLASYPRDCHSDTIPSGSAADTSAAGKRALGR